MRPVVLKLLFQPRGNLFYKSLIPQLMELLRESVYWSSNLLTNRFTARTHPKKCERFRFFRHNIKNKETFIRFFFY